MTTEIPDASGDDDGGLRFRWGGCTDVGRVRDVNQDNLFTRDGLFVVADGMGGHRGGEVASAVAVAAMEHVADPLTVDVLVESVRLANAAVFQRADGDADLQGMGTTLCAIARVTPGQIPATETSDNAGDAGTDSKSGATVTAGKTNDAAAAPSPFPDVPGSERQPQPDRIGIANVGDSRVYLFTDGDLVQISHDHSLVETMVREGQLTAEEAATHPQRNVITRALGMAPDVDVDYWELDARTGDRYILCSDGLFGEVNDQQIAAVLRRLADPDEAARELVRVANAHGARDNVTVVVVDIDQGLTNDRVSVPLLPRVSRRANLNEPMAMSDHVDGADEAAQQSAMSGAIEAAGPARVSRKMILVFVLAVLAVMALAFFFISQYARDNYFVTFDVPSGVDADRDDAQLVILQGRPGGVLWFDPTTEAREPVLARDLTDALRLEVDAEPEFATFAEAQKYARLLSERAADATSDG